MGVQSPFDAKAAQTVTLLAMLFNISKFESMINFGFYRIALLNLDEQNWPRNFFTVVF